MNLTNLMSIFVINSSRNPEGTNYEMQHVVMLLFNMLYNYSASRKNSSGPLFKGNLSHLIQIDLQTKGNWEYHVISEVILHSVSFIECIFHPWIPYL